MDLQAKTAFVKLYFIYIIASNFSHAKLSLLQNISRCFKDLRIPLMMFDQTVFKNILENSSSSFHQTNRLATFSTYLNLKQEKLLHELKLLNYDVNVTSKPDPWNYEKFFITSQIIIMDNVNTNEICIQVLYERLNEYWWYFYSLQEFKDPNDSSLRILPRVQLKTLVVNNIAILIPTDIERFLLGLDKEVFMPCNYTRSLEFLEKYPQDVSLKARKFKSTASSLLSIAKRLLDELSIPFWLSSGTCLGFLRQCDIITYSKDVDIGIFISDYKPEIIPKFVSNGLNLIHVFGMVEDSFELSFQHLGIKLDIFFFYKEEEYYWNGGVQARTGKKFKYKFPKFGLCWTEFLKMKIRIPCPTESYIKANYGDEWIYPITEWDWKSSPPNVEENGVWPREIWSRVIQDNKNICIIK